MGYHSFQQGVLGAFAFLDICIQILAILGNTLVLIAVINVQIGLVGFRRFLISLLANNIFLCVSQVFIAIYLEFDTTIDRQHSCVGTFLDSLKLFAVFAALFNLSGMSFDHLIGIGKPIKYDYLMNRKIAKAAPFLIWVFAFFFAFADIPVAAVVYYIYSYRPVATGATYRTLYDALVNSSATMASSSTASGDYAIQQPMFIVPTSPLFEDLGHLGFNIDDSGLQNMNTIVPLLSQDMMNDALSSLMDIDRDLLEEETDWCLISHSYKLYRVQWFRLVSTVFVFAFLLFCYGRIYSELHDRKKSKMLANSLSSASSENNQRQCVCAEYKATSHSLISNANYQRPLSMPLMAQLSMALLPVSHQEPNSQPRLSVSPLRLLNISYRRQTKLQAQRRSSRKFVMTTLCLLSAFAVCWLPFIIFEISVSPDALIATAPEDVIVSRMHILQHLFNSLFLSYPLLDAIICVTRVDSVRKYIYLILLILFRCNKSGRFPNGTVPDTLKQSTEAPVTVLTNSLQRQSQFDSSFNSFVKLDAVLENDSISPRNNDETFAGRCSSSADLAEANDVIETNHPN